MFEKSLVSQFAVVLISLVAASCVKTDKIAEPGPGSGATESTEVASSNTTGAADRDLSAGDKTEASETIEAATSPLSDAAGSAPGHPAPGHLAPIQPAVCAARLAEFDEVSQRIPLVFMDLKRPRAIIESDINAAIQMGEAILDGDECKGLSESARAGVMARVARYYISLIDRHIARYKKAMTKELQASGRDRKESRSEVSELVAEERVVYLARIRNYSDRALKDAASGSAARYEALATAADLAKRDYDFGAQIELARKILVEFPDCAQRSKWLLDVGKGFRVLGRYQEAVDWLRDVVAKHNGDVEYVAYNGLLLEALNGIGDLEGMEELMRSIQKEYPERLKSVESPGFLDQYHQFYDLSNFWIGFARYAQGDISVARQAFTDCLNHLEKRETELAREGKGLPPVQKVFRDFRVLDHLMVLDRHQGQIPRVGEGYETKLKTADLTSGVLWVSEDSVTLGKAEGRVVALLFRLPGDARSKTFYSELDDLSQAMPGVDAVNLAFLPSRASESMTQMRVDKMRAERQKLNINMFCGFDRSENQALFRSLHGTVGTASFVVFDREGKFAWYLADPQDMDRAILRRVLERLAKG